MGSKKLIDPWELQEDETQTAFEAFVVYRDEKPRSLTKTSKTLGKSVTTIREWSERFSWVSRAAAWDREQDRVKREADLKAATAMGKRHAEEAAKIQDGLLMPMRELAARITKRMAADPDGDPLSKLSDLELIREATKAARVYAQVGVFERLSRGMSTSNVGGHEGGPIEVEHRQRVERMQRPEMESYLLGIGPDAAAIAAEYNLPEPPAMNGSN